MLNEDVSMVHASLSILGNILVILRDFPRGFQKFFSRPGGLTN